MINSDQWSFLVAGILKMKKKFSMNSQVDLKMNSLTLWL